MSWRACGQTSSGLVWGIGLHLRLNSIVPALWPHLTLILHTPLLAGTGGWTSRLSMPPLMCTSTTRSVRGRARPPGMQSALVACAISMGGACQLLPPTLIATSSPPMVQFMESVAGEYAELRARQRTAMAEQVRTWRSFADEGVHLLSHVTAALLSCARWTFDSLSCQHSCNYGRLLCRWPWMPRC